MFQTCRMCIRGATVKNVSAIFTHTLLEINQDVAIKMFEKLKQKVHNANENGLNSLL